MSCILISSWKDQKKIEKNAVEIQNRCGSWVTSCLLCFSPSCSIFPSFLRQSLTLTSGLMRGMFCIYPIFLSFSLFVYVFAFTWIDDTYYVILFAICNLDVFHGAWWLNRKSHRQLILSKVIKVFNCHLAWHTWDDKLQVEWIRNIPYYTYLVPPQSASSFLVFHTMY